MPGLQHGRWLTAGPTCIVFIRYDTAQAPPPAHCSSPACAARSLRSRSRWSVETTMPRQSVTTAVQLCLAGSAPAAIQQRRALLQPRQRPPRQVPQEAQGRRPAALHRRLSSQTATLGEATISPAFIMAVRLRKAGACWQGGGPTSGIARHRHCHCGKLQLCAKYPLCHCNRFARRPCPRSLCILHSAII